VCTKNKKLFLYLFVERKKTKNQRKNTMVLALTSVTYNDRETLPIVVSDFLQNTDVPKDTVWYMVMQNCTDGFCEKIISLCEGKIELVLIRFAKNIGLSKSMAFIIEQTKYFEYVLNMEDDWRVLPKRIPNKQWLYTSLKFLDERKDATAVFLRAYGTDQEKWQYGWTRTIPYMNHKHKDNFNYQEKMKGSERVVLDGVTFALIPCFLFSFNPLLCRNADLHKHVYPLDIFPLDQKQKEANSQWGYCEALAMERMIGLHTFFFNDGIVGHAEDWVGLV
jgi:GT2 family glycosyltransferase